LDPFADFVGLPVPLTRRKPYRILYLRHETINRAELIFVDELNRAHPRLVNAVLEVVQFRTINGERLPHLRSVIAVINPPEPGFHVHELDPALADRFHIHLHFEGGPDRGWFIGEFGSHLGGVLVDWYENDLDDKQRAQVSNRRLAYVGVLIRHGIDPRHAFQDKVKLPVHMLEARLDMSLVLTVPKLVGTPGKVAAQLSDQLDLAVGVAHLVARMGPEECARCTEVILALSGELLQGIQAESPELFDQTRQMIARQSGSAAAGEFWRRLLRRMGGKNMD